MSVTVKVITRETAARVVAFPRTDGAPDPAGEYTELGIVDPNSELQFAANSVQDILVQEIQAPPEGD